MYEHAAACGSARRYAAALERPNRRDAALSVHGAGMADGRKVGPGRIQPLRAHHHHGHEPEHGADGEQDAGNHILDRWTTGPGPDEEGAGERAENRQDRRGSEMPVLDRVLPEHENRNVDDGEDSE